MRFTVRCLRWLLITVNMCVCITICGCFIPPLIDEIKEDRRRKEEGSRRAELEEQQQKQVQERQMLQEVQRKQQEQRRIEQEREAIERIEQLLASYPDAMVLGTFDGGSISGGRSRSNVVDVINQNKSSLRVPYIIWLSKNPELQGTIMIRADIDDNGWVKSASAIRTSVNAPKFVETVVNLIKGWDFGKIDKPGDLTGFVYTFDFSPGQKEIVITSEPSGANISVSVMTAADRHGFGGGFQEVTNGTTPFTWKPPARGQIVIAAQMEGRMRDTLFLNYTGDSVTHSFVMKIPHACPATGKCTAHERADGYFECTNCRGRVSDKVIKARAEAAKRDAQRELQAHTLIWAAARAQCVGNGGLWCDAKSEVLQAYAAGLEPSNLLLLRVINQNLGRGGVPECSYNGRCD